MSLPRLRRRGATFCVIVLLSSGLLLAIGGAFVESSRNLVVLNGLRERNEQARQALAGAAAWARAGVAQGQGAGVTTLKLSKVTVDVELKVADGAADAYFMTASAKTIDGVLRAKASIARRDGRWVISRYELLEGIHEPKPADAGGKKFR
jgi:hypothetical protein